MHSHIALESSPILQGSDDTNSLNGPILPWLRAVDAMNTHDESFRLSAAGGVTTSLILPGSANAIGDLLVDVSVYRNLLTKARNRRWTSIRAETSTDPRKVALFAPA